MGDLYYLSPQYRSMTAPSWTTDSGNGLGGDFPYASLNIQTAFNDIFSGVAKNSFGLNGVTTTTHITNQSIISNPSSFYPLPAYNTIKFNGLTEAQSKAVYDKVASEYGNMQQQYVSFQKLSSEIAGGKYLESGLLGLSSIEQQSAQIVDSLSKSGVVPNADAVWGDSRIEGLGNVISFGYDFNANALNQNSMGMAINPYNNQYVPSTTPTSTGLSASNCCCAPEINSKVASIQPKAEEIFPKETAQIAQANKVLGEMITDIRTKVGKTYTDGTVGQMIATQASAYYQDSKHTIALLEKMKRTMIVQKEAEIASIKGNIIKNETALGGMRE